MAYNIFRMCYPFNHQRIIVHIICPIDEWTAISLPEIGIYFPLNTLTTMLRCSGNSQNMKYGYCKDADIIEMYFEMY